MAGRILDKPYTGICPACDSQSVNLFFGEDSLPQNSCLLMDNPESAANFPRGKLELGFCESCGFVFNTAFEPGSAEYSQRYEETQGFSAKFMSFAKDLAEQWVRDYKLQDKTVLEIGCGKGEFLLEMVKAGTGKCIGIDPGVHPERIVDPVAAQVEWITDFYDERYTHLNADVVICRHTLEHIPDVADFMSSIRLSIGDRTDTVVLFELPAIERVLEEIAFWDIYYEHCSYFSLGSLSRLFRKTGFEVIELSKEYDDQYLLIAAKPSTVPAQGKPLPEETDMHFLRDGVTNYQSGYAALQTKWQRKLTALKDSGSKIVIWGSGSKGVSFINNLNLGDELAAAVDINPHKWGKYMVGSSHKIISPEELIAIKPDLVVAMNPIYVEEIRRDLQKLGLNPELTAV